MKNIIIFVCHDIGSVKFTLNSDKNAHIIFVGDKSVVYDAILNNPNIIIARNLPNNIEHEKKLLTFTAWYLIVKNNLFPDYDFFTVLEYDVVLDKGFKQNLDNELASNEFDVISFNHFMWSFLMNVELSVCEHFVQLKNINFRDVYSKIHQNGWYPTTNQCIKKQVLIDFVNWYYPDYLEIKNKDLHRLSWYHERMFSVFIYHYNLRIKAIPGLKHLSRDSHRMGYNR
jgi:hypothetical protein